jgi:hypothetical protein
VFVNDVLISDTAFGDTGQDFSGVTYTGCLFQRLDLPPEAEVANLPKFRDCFFSVIEGRTSLADLPAGVFDDKCVVDTFGDSATSTAAIMELPLAMGARVALTILKKLYLQAGSGRRESALSRGLDHRARPLVQEVLQLLRKEGLTVRSATGDEVVWLPIRSEAVRVRKLIAAPSTEDLVLAEAGRLG